MRMADFDYELPPEAIAQEPVEPRDASRLLVLHRDQGRLEHRIFRDLPEYLRPPDVLVVNESRVRPARLVGEKEGTGGVVELLLLRPDPDGAWECLARPGRRLRPGHRLVFGGGELRAEVLASLPGSPAGVRRVRLEHEGSLDEVLERLGKVPLPPYIHRELEDPERYQTVYAKEVGSTAAPTASPPASPWRSAPTGRTATPTRTTRSCGWSWSSHSLRCPPTADPRAPSTAASETRQCPAAPAVML